MVYYNPTCWWTKLLPYLFSQLDSQLDSIFIKHPDYYSISIVNICVDLSKYDPLWPSMWLTFSLLLQFLSQICKSMLVGFTVDWVVWWPKLECIHMSHSLNTLNPFFKLLLIFIISANESILFIKFDISPSQEITGISKWLIGLNYEIYKERIYCWGI